MSSPDPTWSGQGSTDGSVSGSVIIISGILLLPLLLKFPPPHIHDNDDDHDNNDDQDQALSPESRHSNGSALGLGTSPVVQVLASSY